MVGYLAVTGMISALLFFVVATVESALLRRGLANDTVTTWTPRILIFLAVVTLASFIAPVFQMGLNLKWW